MNYLQLQLIHQSPRRHASEAGKIIFNQIISNQIILSQFQFKFLRFLLAHLIRVYLRFSSRPDQVPGPSRPKVNRGIIPGPSRPKVNRRLFSHYSESTPTRNALQTPRRLLSGHDPTPWRPWSQSTSRQLEIRAPIQNFNDGDSPINWAARDQRVGNINRLEEALDGLTGSVRDRIRNIIHQEKQCLLF